MNIENDFINEGLDNIAMGLAHMKEQGHSLEDIQITIRDIISAMFRFSEEIS